MTVIELVLLMVGVALKLVHAPLPNLYCAQLPARNPVPVMVTGCGVSLATIELTLRPLTVGTTVAATTEMLGVLTEQLVPAELVHTRR